MLGHWFKFESENA